MSFTSGLETVENSVTQVSDVLNKYVVKPSTYFGISGFVFEGDGETSVEQRSEITDNVIENNSTVQDNIAVKPLRVTMQRYVGELAFMQNDNIEEVLGNVLTTLTPIVALAPSMVSSVGDIQKDVTSDAVMDSNLLADTDNLWGLFKNMNPMASRKQKTFLYFQALSEQGATFSIDTPFQYFTDMAIESITARESALSKDIASFSITMKKINYAYTTTSTVGADQMQGRASQQNADPKNQGQASGSGDSTAATLTGVGA